MGGGDCGGRRRGGKEGWGGGRAGGVGKKRWEGVRRGWQAQGQRRRKGTGVLLWGVGWSSRDEEDGKGKEGEGGISRRGGVWKSGGEEWLTGGVAGRAGGGREEGGEGGRDGGRGGGHKVTERAG